MLISLRRCYSQTPKRHSNEQTGRAIERSPFRAPLGGVHASAGNAGNEPSRAIETWSGGARSAEALYWSAEKAVFLRCTFSKKTPQYQVIMYPCIARVYKSSKEEPIATATFPPADPVHLFSLPHSNLFRNRTVSRFSPQYRQIKLRTRRHRPSDAWRSTGLIG